MEEPSESCGSAALAAVGRVFRSASFLLFKEFTTKIHVVHMGPYHTKKYVASQIPNSC